ncbi:MAG: outer membrane protein assembly factor [Nitrospirales bacterium]|nr:BamA/TamA family outer membrane protein [Nitrospira sp.]MDR4501372.1 outer membrane protein assembly factor [Nitrospirales bacterium]
MSSIASLAIAKRSIFGVPAISTSKNDGRDFGIIVPILESDDEGNLVSLMAPMVIHNSFLGVRGTMNYYRYWSAGRQLEFVGSYTEDIERKLKIQYKDPGFIQGLFFLDVGAEFFKNATKRFYGIGQTTPKSNETNYTSREIGVRWNFGIHLNDVTRLMIGQRYRDVEMQPGGVDTLPYTKDRFPGVDGTQRVTILANRLSFQYDSRDNLVTPTAGVRAEAYAEAVHNFQRQSADDFVYFRYGVDVRALFPSPSKRLILAVRGNVQLSVGSGIPFYERSSLGGQDNLRGYGQDRFIDRHLVSLNVEERIHALGINLFNVNVEFEVVPFIDMGRTYRNFKYRQFNEYELTPGIGFRGIVRPNVVGRVDWAYSKDGGAVFAGLSYPF